MNQSFWESFIPENSRLRRKREKVEREREMKHSEISLLNISYMHR